jgi:hypothetical protein
VAGERAFSYAVAALALSFPFVARAADESVHVRGSIASTSASSLTVTTDKGPVVVLLGQKTLVAGALPASAADIKTGTFIGSANVEGSGPARALEVVVFPESLRGVGEGDYPWDLPAGTRHSAMTHGTVAAPHGSSPTDATVSRMSDGGAKTITVAYKGGTKEIAISPTVPIVRLEKGTPRLLVPGARVFVVAIPKDGKLGGAAVIVGEKGTVPPM